MTRPATATTPARILRAHGVEICVQTFGSADAEPVLLIAGAASTMLYWDEEFCAGLAAGPRFVLRYDHRDTGRSTTCPPGAPDYTAVDLLDDAIGLLDALGIDRAHLVGLSMGGGLAQLAAIAHPDRVASLTLIAASPAGPAEHPRPAVDVRAGAAEFARGDRAGLVRPGRGDRLPGRAGAAVRRPVGPVRRGRDAGGDGPGARRGRRASGRCSTTSWSWAGTRPGTGWSRSPRPPWCCTGRGPGVPARARGRAGRGDPRRPAGSAAAGLGTSGRAGPGPRPLPVDPGAHRSAGV